MNLDLGCGYRLSPGFVGIDIVPLDKLFPGLKPPYYEGNFIPWDLWQRPWPIEESVVDVAHLNYFVNFIPHHLPDAMGPLAPKLDGFYLVFEELWRVMKPYGRVQITYEPYTAEAAVWNPSIQRPIHAHTFDHLSRAWRDDSIVEDPDCDFVVESWNPVAGTAHQVILSTVKSDV